MKKILVLTAFLALIFTAAKAQKIEEINGIYYKNSEKFTGTYIDLYDDQVIKSEIKIKNGEKHGKTIIYFQNGYVNEIRAYKKNQMHGKWIMFNEHGIKTSVAKYKNGKKHGKWKIWNDYGNLLYTLQYSDGTKSGVWKNYNEKGEVIKERNF